MNKVSRITALGIGLYCGFFVSCKKVNAVSVMFNNTLVLSPENGYVFQIPKDANKANVQASLGGALNIALAWDNKDLDGDYTIGASAILGHDKKSSQSGSNSALTFTKVAKVGTGGNSAYINCPMCVPPPVSGLFGTGKYATSYNLSVVFSKIPTSSPSGTGGTQALDSAWSVVPPTPVPWETDSISLIVTTGFFLGGVAIKGKLAKKNLESTSEEPKI